MAEAGRVKHHISNNIENSRNTILLVGYCEGIDSERGIAWRVADSLSLREFLGFGLAEQTPDHSTISRTGVPSRTS